MKKNFFPILALTGLLGLSFVSANAASISYSTTFDAVNNFTNFTLSQFQTSLGTLTGVKITVDFSTLQGSFDVENRTGALATVSQADNALTIQAVTAGLGYATKHATIYDMVTTPDWSSIDIGAGDLVTFSIDGGQNLLLNDQTSISSAYFGAYKGNGTITLKAKDVNSVTTTGVSYGVDSSKTKANTKVTVTYDYTAIPEPTTWALCMGGLGVLVVGQRMRRRLS